MKHECIVIYASTSVCMDSNTHVHNEMWNNINCFAFPPNYECLFQFLSAKASGNQLGIQKLEQMTYLEGACPRKVRKGEGGNKEEWFGRFYQHSVSLLEKGRKDREEIKKRLPEQITVKFTIVKKHKVEFLERGNGRRARAASTAVEAAAAMACCSATPDSALLLRVRSVGTCKHA